MLFIDNIHELVNAEDIKLETNTPTATTHTQTTQIMTERIPCKEFLYEGDSSTMGSRWEKWLKRFKLFLIANKMTDPAQNKATFLMLIGEEAFEIYDTLKKVDESDSLEELYRKMTDHFVGLRQLSDHCNFGDKFESQMNEIVENSGDSSVLLTSGNEDLVVKEK